MFDKVLNTPLLVVEILQNPGSSSTVVLLDIIVLLTIYSYIRWVVLIKKFLCQPCFSLLFNQVKLHEVTILQMNETCWP